jgi:hypothetical protein
MHKLMKLLMRILYTTALLFSAQMVVNAQSLSFDGGYIATQYKNMSPFTQSKGGFQFGVAYIKPIKESVLHVKTGLYYQQLDGRGQITYFNQINQAVLSYEKTQELYYLSIPVLLQWDVIRIKKLVIGLQGGLTYNYLLRAWHNPQREGVDHNVTNQFNRSVLGYQAGVYVAAPISEMMSMQLHYVYGGNITEVQKDGSGSGFNTQTIQLGLVYALK